MGQRNRGNRSSGCGLVIIHDVILTINEFIDLAKACVGEDWSEFDKQASRNVHPCPEIVGEKTARAIRHRFDPTQYHLNEYSDGTRPVPARGEER